MHKRLFLHFPRQIYKNSRTIFFSRNSRTPRRPANPPSTIFNICWYCPTWTTAISTTQCGEDQLHREDDMQYSIINSSKVLKRHYSGPFIQLKCLKGLAPCLSYWSLCWHRGCSGSFWFEICSSRWSCCAGTQDRVGSRSFAVAGLKCWNKLPVGLRDLSVGPETFARHLKTRLFRAGFSD